MATYNREKNKENLCAWRTTAIRILFTVFSSGPLDATFSIWTERLD